jgi:dipeptidyl aminopeptidase/acylaminoacyl peptidase
MKHFLRPIFLLLLTCSISALAAEKIPFQPQDIFKLKSASNPLISPDGTRIVYQVRSIDVANDTPTAETWIMNTDGSDNRQLTKEGGGFAWSPDSSKLAYIAAGSNEKAQIFLLDMDKPAAGVQISSLDESLWGLSWSPDGKSIAFYSFVPGESPWQVALPEAVSKPAGANWSEEPLVIDSINYRADRAGYLPYGNDHVFVISTDGGEVRQLTSGDWSASIIMYGANRSFLAWHPDGKRIFFPAIMGKDADLSYAGYINEVSLETGEAHRVTGEEGVWGAPKVSPDGKYLAYVGFDSAASPVYQMQELWVSRIDGSDRRRVSGDLDDTVYNYFWANDSRTLYFNLAKNGERQLYSTTLKGKPKRLTSGEHMLFPSSLSADGMIAGARLSGTEPAEVFIAEAKRPKNFRQLTHLNDWLYEERKRGAFQRIDFVSADGTSVQQWLQLPPDFDSDKKYPLIVWIHGGPYSAYGQYYQETVDYLAAKGYVVALINYRSTVGYGTEFAGGVTGGFPGKQDFEDIMGGVDAALAEGYVDVERMFVAGCSAGGIETAWVVAHTDRFKAAVAMCAIVNQISAITSDYPIWGFRHRAKPFWEDASDWLEHSSIMYVDQVKTPTAVFVGENDTGTPVSQSLEYFVALRTVGVPTKLVLLRDEGHWFIKPLNKIRMIEYMLDWFNQYDPALQ